MSQVIRSEVTKLMDEKQRIENEISSFNDILTQSGVGMSEPLVDDQGYPLNTVDIHQVRVARNRIICLQNDHKAIMNEIEKRLGDYYDVKSTETMSVDEEQLLDPIAQVNMVTKDSPADIDGIEVNDLIIQFHTLNQNTFKSLRDFSEVTNRCIDRKIVVKVQRDDVIKTIYLTPRRWHGKGVLGCNILPVEQVER